MRRLRTLALDGGQLLRESSLVVSPHVSIRATDPVVETVATIERTSIGASPAVVLRTGVPRMLRKRIVCTPVTSSAVSHSSVSEIGSVFVQSLTNVPETDTRKAFA